MFGTQNSSAYYVSVNTLECLSPPSINENGSIVNYYLFVVATSQKVDPGISYRYYGLFLFILNNLHFSLFFHFKKS